MTHKKASLDLLAQLHELTAQVMLAKVRSGEVTAADLAAITKFLRDNGIQVMPGEDENINDLVAELPFDEDDDNVVTFGR
jgi:hypothetical protein